MNTKEKLNPHDLFFFQMVKVVKFLLKKPCFLLEVAKRTAESDRVLNISEGDITSQRICKQVVSPGFVPSGYFILHLWLPLRQFQLALTCSLCSGISD